MSELKITKNSLQNGIFEDGQLVFGRFNNPNQYVDASGAGALAHGGWDIDSGWSDCSVYADGAGAYAGGVNATAIGVAAHAEGAGNAIGPFTHAEGYYTNAIANSAHAEGRETKATGINSHAEGWDTSALGTASHAEGWRTTAYGEGSHVEGVETQISNAKRGNPYGAHAEGVATYADEIAAHVEGWESTASGFASHAEGIQTETNNSGSHAEGGYYDDEADIMYPGGKASGQGSHAEGISTYALGNGTHAEGGGSKNIIENRDSTIVLFKWIKDPDDPTIIQSVINVQLGGALEEGILDVGNIIYYEGTDEYREIIERNDNGLVFTLNKAFSDVPPTGSTQLYKILGAAYGAYSHAEGDSTVASGNGAHASGIGTIANQEGMTAIGKYNVIPNDGTLFVVGCGTSSNARHNAFKIHYYSNDRATVRTITLSIGSSTIEYNKVNDRTHHVDHTHIKITNEQQIILDAQDVSVNGEVHASGGFYDESDIRKKDILSTISLEKSYELLDKCQEIIYTLKEDPNKKEQLGMIAQEVEEFFPEVISTDNNGFKSLDYARLSVICLRLIKDIVEQIKELKNEIKNLKN